MPGTVLEFVAGARRRRKLRTGLECFALGLAALFLGVAASWISSPETAPPAGRLALALCGLVCGAAMAATWWVERAKPTDLELARKLDARLGRDGALASAFEARARKDHSPLLGLLEARVIAGLDRESLRRALPGIGWIWLAPPALCAAILALAFEVPRESEHRRGVVELAGDAMGRAQRNARANAVLERSRELRTAAGQDPRLREQVLEELEVSIRDMSSAAVDPGSPDPGPAADRRLLEQLEAEQAALAADGRAQDPNLPAGASSDPSKALAAGAESTSASEAGSSVLTREASDRTMSGSNRPMAAADGARTANQVPDSGSPGEAGTLAGRWWEERYDPVVQGWRRALAARREQH